MKKFFSILLLGLLVVQTIDAQEFKKFRVAMGAGYAIASGDASGGLFGTLEPGYRLSDQIALGLRFELAGIARGAINDQSIDVDVSKITSLTLNAIYYLKNEGARPFAGIGVGNYALSSIEYRLDTSGTAEETGKESKFGLYPRIGIDLGHLVLSIDYNFIPKTMGANQAEFKNNYLALRLGAFFGGGRNK